MKRLFTSVIAVAIVASPSTALAQPIVETNSIPAAFHLQIATPKTSTISLPKESKPAEKPKEPAKPEPVVYSVIDGDNLSKIGTAHNVEWQRLWAKNTQLADPDLIHVGDNITIPLPDEALSREIPANVALPAVTPGVEPVRTAAVPQATNTAVYDAGNTYDYGYCTWYVKNRRGASIPNSLGNANTWYSRAAAQGMAVGSTPRAGAVGTTTRGAYGHVIYVESVNGDGSINISEMNAPVFGGVTYRTASASEFSYIY